MPFLRKSASAHAPMPRALPGRRRWLSDVAAAALIVGSLGVGSLGAAALWNNSASAESATSNGWTTSGTVSATPVNRGSDVIVTLTVTSSISRTALVDIEILGGNENVHQQ